MKSKTLDKITLIIPTYNRYSRLRRLLKFYKSLNFPVKTLILDSSSDTLDRNKFNDLLSHHRVNYKSFASDVIIAGKILDGLEGVETPYSVICADDDLLTPSFFEEGIEFLEKNRDFSIVHGQSAVFNMNPDQDSSTINWIATYHQRFIANDTARDRLMNHLDNYSTTYYSIHRTEDLKRNMKMCYDYGFCYGFVELAPSCLSVIQGKVGKIKRLYMLKECHEDRDSLSAGVAKKNDNSVLNFITSLNFRDNYGKFNICLAEELSRKDCISLSEAQELVRQGFMLYLRKKLYSESQLYKKNKSRLHIKEAIKCIPFTESHFFPIWRFLRSNLFCQDELSLKALLRFSSPYHDDFIPVYSVITKNEFSGKD